MPDGSKWDVPFSVICNHYYEHNKAVSPISVQTAKDWAENNMNWEDVEAHAVLHYHGDVDYADGWINGEKEIVEK